MDEVLAVTGVAQYRRVHSMTVQRWCRSGSPPAAKIGRAYRVKQSALEAWWAQRTIGEEAADAVLKRSSRPAAARRPAL